MGLQGFWEEEEDKGEEGKLEGYAGVEEEGRFGEGFVRWVGRCVWDGEEVQAGISKLVARGCSVLCRSGRRSYLRWGRARGR